MIRGYDIVGILRKLISEMKLTVKVKAFIDNGDGTFTITTCDTSYLNAYSIFKVNDIEYSVVEITNNESVKIKGAPVLSTNFTLSPPLFIPDSAPGANYQILARSTDIYRHPFIWLLENFPTDYDFSKSDTVAEPRCRLFFLTGSENSKWLEDEHRENCIEPIFNLVDAFLLELQKKVSGKISEFTITNRIRFGVWSDDKGNQKHLLDEELSGVELDIRIPIKKWSIKCVEGC